eukprot:scaffold406_cov391-Prasinococcus_capsulatus_cf.AAC.11
MGISGVTLTHILDEFFEDHETRLWGRLFSCEYDGPITIQESGQRPVDELLGSLHDGHGAIPHCLPGLANHVQGLHGVAWSKLRQAVLSGSSKAQEQLDLARLTWGPDVIGGEAVCSSNQIPNPVLASLQQLRSANQVATC